MGKVIKFPDKMKRHNETWNEGYSDGYRGRDKQMGKSEGYYIGYAVGKDDRDEDEVAIASGDCDMLNDEERIEIFGNETDRI